MPKLKKIFQEIKKRDGEKTRNESIYVHILKEKNALYIYIYNTANVVRFFSTLMVLVASLRPSLSPKFGY